MRLEMSAEFHNVQGIVGNVGFWLILRALRSQCSSILQMGVH